MMLSWREREHEIEDVIAANDPWIVQALRNCVWLKYLWILGMRAQMDLLQYLVTT